MGHTLAKEVDFTTFTAQRDGDSQNFDLAGLKATRFLAASESSKYQTLNPRRIKAATGGNQIRAAFKHRDLFEYFPQFHIFLSSNEIVNADPDDDALWGRVRVIKFPHSHLGHEDKTLKRQMLETSNLEGVLAWAVQGARMWYDSLPVGLRMPPAVQGETDAHRRENDHVEQFLDECTDDCRETMPDAFVSNKSLYPVYAGWCDDNGHRAYKQTGLTRSLKRKGFVCDRNEKCLRGVFGFKLSIEITKSEDEIPF